MSFTIPSQKRSNRSAGQALVEFAILVPLLLFLLVGIIDLGRVFHAYIAVTNASREGARYVTLHQDLYENEGECDCEGVDCFDPLDTYNLKLKQVVIDEVSNMGLDISINNVCFNIDDDNPPSGIRGDPVRVTVRYGLELILGWFFTEPLQLSHSTEMLIP